MFLFYTLMCRNYQEYKWKPRWSQIGTFQKSMLELFSKMVTLRVEDGIKQKTFQLQSCREFQGERYGHKIYLILSPNDWDKPAPLQPQMGRWESERLYKGRNSSSWDISTHEFAATRATFLPSPWIPSLWGRAPMKPWRKGLRGSAPPWCQRWGSPPRPSLPISVIFTTISITNSSYYAVVHPPTHLCNVLCKYGVWCYNIHPMIYVMFA
jgi:hypothetical protein